MNYNNVNETASRILLKQEDNIAKKRQIKRNYWAEPVGRHNPDRKKSGILLFA